MKILVVSEPGADGVFRHVEQLVSFLHRRAVQVALAYSSNRSSDRLPKLVDSVIQAGGATLDLRIGNAPQARDAFAVLSLWALCREFRPDVIHCHSSKAGVLGRGVASLLNIPVVYTPNAYFGMGKKVGAKAAIFSGLERIFGRVGHTINVSEDEARFAREQLHIKSDRQHMIRNPVDTEVFRPSSRQERLAWRSKYGIPPDAVVVGTLGRLSYQKDPLTLYKAFAIVLQRFPNAYLAHAGTGELQDECKSFAQNANFISKLIRIEYQSEPSDFYKGLDTFVLSSRYEGLSLAVLYALASGLPLALTDVAGNRDFLRFGLSHLWTAPAESPAALAQAIGECVDSLGNGVPCNHRQIAVERFSEETCFGQILDLYKQLGRHSKN